MLKILGHRVSITGKLSCITHPTRSQIANLLALRLTSKEFNTLATELWGKNDHLLQYPTYAKLHGHDVWKSSIPGAPFAKHVRNLELKFLVSALLERAPSYLHHNKGPYAWSLLFARHKPSIPCAYDTSNVEHSNIAWQKSLRSLRHERLVEVKT
jgi:hypothetical protein